MNPQDEKMKAETKEARRLLAQIEQFVAALESKESPNWATVGDASRLRNDLQQIVRYTRSLR